ncbi:MAG: 30S ribosomal protein S6 [Acidobacteriota bacterium]
MTRTYELGFVVEPRLNDDEVQEMIQRYRGVIEDAGATITEEEHWGKRKLAYPINKYSEGRYVFLHLSSETGQNGIPEVERLMRQNDRILRYLTVRTDLDLKRALRRGKPGTPGAQPKPEAPVSTEDADLTAASSDEAKPAAATEAAATEAAATETAAAETTATETASTDDAASTETASTEAATTETAPSSDEAPTEAASSDTETKASSEEA